MNTLHCIPFVLSAWSPVGGVGVVLPVEVWHVENDGGALVLKVSIHSELTIAENNIGSLLNYFQNVHSNLFGH